MKRQRGELREEANASKQRLAGGFWHGTGIDIAKDQIANPKVEPFEEKVKRLVKEGHSNPVSEMLDKTHMETLFGPERERYILETSSRVQQVIMSMPKKKKG
ncbi:MAG: hypothetical protein FWE31_04455 [Firmicutes bacterium]|nr:hypothetical protein [Bacillota bacterium]